MTYADFVEKVMVECTQGLGDSEGLIRMYPKGYAAKELEDRLWVQNICESCLGQEGDELPMDAMRISMPGPDGVSTEATVLLENLYQKGQECGFDEAIRETREQIENVSGMEAKPGVLSCRQEGHYEEIREHLILRPLNWELHGDQLRDCLYRKIGDFALVLYQWVGKAKHSLYSSKIRKEELAWWGMSDRVGQVMEEALANTARLFPACVYDKRLGKEVDFLASDVTRNDITFSGFILMSTFATTNGAVSLFYPGVREKMLEVMGGPFQAVFMNVNDVMIFAEGDRKAEEFAQLAMDSSRMGETLSGRIYRCDKGGIMALPKQDK